MGAAAVCGAVGAAQANAEWRKVNQRAEQLRPTVVPAAPVPGKCPCCGSWEYKPSGMGVVCAYCRVPMGTQRRSLTSALFGG